MIYACHFLVINLFQDDDNGNFYVYISFTMSLQVMAWMVFVCGH